MTGPCGTVAGPPSRTQPVHVPGRGRVAVEPMNARPSRTVGVVTQDAGWPAVAPGMIRVHFTGGDLGGAVVDLPETGDDTRPGQLIITANGDIYDRADNCRPVPARLLRAPAASRPTRTPVVRSTYL